MLQAITLLTMALQLLVAASNPAIPESLKIQAISVANFAMEVANKAILEEKNLVKPLIPALGFQSTPQLVPQPIPQSVSQPMPQPSPNVPLPEPEPIVSNAPPPILMPTLINDPLLEFTNNQISKITFSANKIVRCDKDFIKWNTNCVLETRKDIDEMFVECKEPIASRIHLPIRLRKKNNIIALCF